MTIGAKLQGRVAVVTGSGGGLGRCHALEFARHGAKVVVNDLARDAADAAAQEIRDAGGEAIAFAGSVADEAAVAAMVAGTLDRWGRIDILVNNAGILRDRSFAKMELDDPVVCNRTARVLRYAWPLHRVPAKPDPDYQPEDEAVALVGYRGLDDRVRYVQLSDRDAAMLERLLSKV